MTTSMKAASYDHYGDPSDIRVVTVPKPAPAAGEVLIRVEASSINSWDWDLVVGSLQGRIGFRGFRRPSIQVLGADVVGVVEAVGPDTDRWEPGDEVMGDLSAAGWGGFGQYVAVRADAVTAKPAELSTPEAAAIPQAGVLALQALDAGRVGDGSKVAINGAGGGVGTFAIQLAKLRGADVTAIDRSAKLERLATLGADRTIDADLTDFTELDDRFDCIVDVISDRSARSYRRVLDRDGHCVIVGGSTGSLLACLLVGLPTSKLGMAHVGLLLHRPRPSDVATVARLAATGQLTPVIDSTFSYTDLPAAFDHYRSGGFVGKIVVTVEG